MNNHEKYVREREGEGGEGGGRYDRKYIHSPEWEER